MDENLSRCWCPSIAAKLACAVLSSNLLVTLASVAPAETSAGEDGARRPWLVDDPPPVQMLVPGFTVHELPVELSNINNVKYRADGTLVALGYDGNIWLLRDTTGDGLEDHAELFWENEGDLRAPIGMDLTPPGYPRGEGVFVVGKNKFVLIVDTNDDGRADEQIEVVGGWTETFQPVDGLGVAFDARDGSVYYGRGTLNFTDPLLRDDEGRSHYSVEEEAGAIIRVSPDFSSRTVVATGIRFPVAIRFNRHGDLFATDQEGATWVPNGNPFDELLHIQDGRHYGFPARHPEHLPDVIDEPSTFDYAPQHQSTCGLNFNEPVMPGGRVFGPDAWASDALVAGYARGKLYRTQLVKTATGYVARTQIIACLGMLTVDACVGPRGELVVACHSGGPDWGSGPTGKGKLFKVTYADPDHPQPVFAWPSGSRELRVEFDRPVDAEQLRDIVANSTLTAGEFVRAGDRFETLQPGYAIVQAQNAAPRIDVPILSAQLTPDGRTLVLATDAISRGVHYGLMLPGMGRTVEEGDLPQHAAIDLDFNLSGCEATWTPSDGGPGWSGWLPHLDLQVARELTAGSVTHDALWKSMNQPGELVLRAKLDLVDMLRPAVQPGSEIDYEYPPESVSVRFETAAPGATLELIVSPEFEHSESENHHAQFATPLDWKEPVPIELRLTSAAGQPALAVSWTTNEDDRPRPLALRRTFVPWADVSSLGDEPPTMPPAPELEGGSWARGYKEFFGDEAACSKCHTIYDRGGDIGPNLSNLVHRDYTSVLRDIVDPSFAINPDHLTYLVTLEDGRVLSGVVRTFGDTLSIGDAEGNLIEVDRSRVEAIEPASISTMPEGIDKQLGSQRMRDLMTFLLTPPPQMPRDHPGPRPKPRMPAEVHAALAGAPDPPQPTRPIHIVLVAGPKDHGPGEHDYPAWQRAWGELLAAAEDVEISTAWEWPSAEQFKSADVIAFYQRGDWTAQRARDIDPILERGGGLVYVHWAVDGRALGRQFAERIGLAALGRAGYRHGEVTLEFNRAANHPITRNFDKLSLVDETYWSLAGALPRERFLATAVEEDEPWPQMWTLEPAGGRVFVSIPGHYSWTFDDPLFRVLLLRGLAWAAGEPVDRFNHLVWPGANLAK